VRLSAKKAAFADLSRAACRISGVVLGFSTHYGNRNWVLTQTL
jgi:hypothetical protein